MSELIKRGPRKGMPRLADNERLYSTSVTLRRTDQEYLRNLGDGNISEGIRVLILTCEMLRGLTGLREAK